MSKGGHFLAQKPEKKTKPWVVVVAVILAVVILIGALGTWFVVSKMNKIQRAEKGDNQLSADDLNGMLVEDDTATEATTAPTETTVPKETRPDYGKTGKVINVLLVGQDAREGEESKNADTMLLVTVNKETKKINMTSFQRDTLVYIPTVYDTNGTPHSGRTKMTLAYALGYKWGGDLGAMEIIDKVIERNFGAIVDKNIEVNMDAFDACINALHGVDIELNADEVKYLNDYFKDYPERVYKEGVNKLDGWAAEMYARTRHSTNADNDFNRTNRQRAVVAAVLEKVKSMSLLEINSLIDELLPMVLTDMTNTDMTTYVAELLPLLPEMTLESLQCPNADMDMYGKTIDLFGDGQEHAVLYFDEAKAKSIVTAITEAD
ncbi:MAG: LCP family protein [Candidatus Faecousia sp.]|nr:LCP family protein [Candidatus Faecousia sp.]